MSAKVNGKGARVGREEREENNKGIYILKGAMTRKYSVFPRDKGNFGKTRPGEKRN